MYLIEKVDKSLVKGPNLIESPVLGPISPDYLSGGVKTLICINKRDDLIFNATACGDNCSPFLLELANDRDIIINLYYCMQFAEPFEIEIMNSGKICRTRDELYDEIAGKYSCKVEYKDGVVKSEW